MPDTTVGSGYIAVNKTDQLPFHINLTYSLETSNKQVNEQTPRQIIQFIINNIFYKENAAGLCEQEVIEKAFPLGEQSQECSGQRNE